MTTSKNCDDYTLDLTCERCGRQPNDHATTCLHSPFYDRPPLTEQEQTLADSLILVKEPANLGEINDAFNKPGHVIHIPEPGFRVEQYRLERISVPEGKTPPFVSAPHIMITKDDGEAMSVNEAVFARMLDWYWKENF